MDRWKMHVAIEYIRLAGEFPFDTDDIEEDVGRVLAFFEIWEHFDKEELAVVRSELKPLALAEEFAEVARLAEWEIQ